MRSDPFASSSFRKDIQGLRAVAVLAVVIFHAWPGALPGGFVGVDIFFVISGFLITTILLRDLEAGRFTLAGFYRRRVRRIFPALFVVLAATLAAGAALLPPADFAELSRHALSTALFVSNVDFTFFTPGGYFGKAAELRPLLHTWSLAVEEQFYLLYPLLLAPLVLRARRHLALILALAVAAGVAFSALGVRYRPDWAYFLAPFRAYELLLGALAAVLPLPALLARAEPRGALALTGAALIAASLLLLSEATPFPGLAALPPTLGSALILYAGRAGGSAPARALSLPPLLAVGAISYSLYLWHWPVMACLRLVTPAAPGPAAMAAAVALSFALAGLSYRFVERPVARMPVTRAPFLRLGLAGMAGTVAIAGGLWLGDGLPGRFPPPARALFAAAADHSPERDRCHQTWNRRIPYAESCVLGADPARPAPVRWAVWGDSHGTELALALSQALPLRQVTSSACPPVIGVDFPQRPRCRSDNDAILAAMEADADLQGVVLAINRVSYRPGGAYPGGAELRRGFEAAVARLRAAGKRVIVLRQIPNIEFDAPRLAGLTLAWGGDPARLGRARAEMRAEAAGWNAFLEALAVRHGLTLHDPAPALCTGGLCPAWLPEAGVLYFNETHVSMAGARRVAAGLAPLLTGCAAAGDPVAQTFSPKDDERRRACSSLRTSRPPAG